MIKKNIQQLKALDEQLDKELIKVQSGVKAAITRARKILQLIKVKAQDLRIELQELKK